ncbi:uncharacterized protein LOC144082976 isoform X4 [Stigmatopora argus]
MRTMTVAFSDEGRLEIPRSCLSHPRLPGCPPLSSPRKQGSLTLSFIGPSQLKGIGRLQFVKRCWLPLFETRPQKMILIRSLTTEKATHVSHLKIK